MDRLEARRVDAAQNALAKAGGLDVIFSSAAGQKRIVFPKRPLGFDFHKAAPIKVDTVIQGSQAQQLGVQSGWTILKINGEVMDGKDFDTKYIHLLNAIKVLPNGTPEQAKG